MQALDPGPPGASSQRPWGPGASHQQACSSLRTSLIHQPKENQSPVACRPSPPTSRLDPALGLVGPWPCPLAGQHKFQDILDPAANCQGLALPISNLMPALGLLGPGTRLQDLALSTSRLALTPGPGFTHLWAGSSPRVLQPDTS